MTDRSGVRRLGVPSRRTVPVSLDPHPDSCSFEDLPSWLAAHADEPLSVDLFCGAGGLSHGLRTLGYTSALGVDTNSRALETHRANFSGATADLDLGSPEGRDAVVLAFEAARVDVVAGGPPCQPFSRAGRSKIRSLVERNGRDPNDRRKELWAGFLDLVERLSPRAVVMENVPDMGLGDDFRVLRTMESRLEVLGYEVDYKLIDAWRFGVPQHRKRLILLARRDGLAIRWPDPVPLVTVRDAIGDLPALPVVPREEVGARRMAFTSAPMSAFQEKLRNGETPEVFDHWTRAVREDDFQAFQHMSDRTLYSDLPAALRRYSADTFNDKYNRLSSDGLSRTITAHIAKDGYWYIHPWENRTLTVREAARIQTFPDSFRFAGSRSDAFRQIGNAVPPRLAEVAGMALSVEEKLPAQASWSRVRKALDAWVAGLGSERWEALHLPGPRSNSLQKLLVVILGSRIGLSNSAYVVDLVNHPKVASGRRRRLDADTYAYILQGMSSRDRARWASRLEQIVDRLDLDEVEAVGVALGLSPSHVKLLSLLHGGDHLVLGAAVQRVAARLCGLEGDKVANGLTEGRVRIARVVGAGDLAPNRMAALRVLGNSVCGPVPSCEACPLASECVFAARNHT